MSDKAPQFTMKKALPASYPRLIVPDTKFNNDGVLHCKLICSPEQAEEFRANALKIAEAYITEDLKTNPKRKAVSKNIGVSISDETDEDGNETGNKLVKFKQNAVIKYKDKKDKFKEKAFSVHLAIFDSKGKQIPTHSRDDILLESAPKIGGGSELKISYDVAVTFMETAKKYHATFRPVAIQIVKLVTPSATAKEASEYGFGEEEGGYEADEAPTFPTTEDPNTTPEEAPDASANY